MAKIQFKIRTRDKVVIARAKMQMRCKLKSGEAWQSDVLTATNAGIIWLEIPDRTLEAINRRTIRYDVSKGGNKLAVNAAAPRKIHDTTFLVEITKKEPDVTRDTDHAVDLTLIGTLLQLNGKVVANAEVDFIERGKVLQSAQSNEKGEALLTLSQSRFNEIDWSKFRISVRKEGVHFHYVRHSALQQRSKTQWTTVVSLKKRVSPEGNDDNKPVTPSLVISGSVYSDDNRPLAAINVRAVAATAGQESPLGQIDTDRKGLFELPLGKQHVVDLKSGSIVVRAFQSGNAKKPLASSALIALSDARRPVNLVVDRDVYRGGSLFDQTHQTLVDLKLDGSLQELGVNDTVLIAKQSGLEKDVITQYLQAAKLAIGAMALLKTRPPFVALAEPFFGVIRAGLAPTARGFAEVRDHPLESLLTRALKENWIDGIEPAAAVAAIRPLRILLMFRELDEWRLLQQLEVAGQNSLNKIADAYLRDKQPLDRVIKAMMEDGDLAKTTGGAILDLLELLWFTGGNSALVEGLSRHHNIDRPLDLIALDESHWRALVKKYIPDLPVWVEGRTTGERQSALARQLRCTVEKTFATPAVLHLWDRDKKLDNREVNWYRNNAALELNRETVAHYAERTGKKPPKNAVKSVERFERLFQICPECDRFRGLKALWILDYQSADQVMDKGRGGFIRHMGQADLPETAATEIYKRAQRVSSHQRLSVEPIPIGGVNDATDGDNSPVLVEPTIASLFGDKGGSGCNDCISAFSPSAYLVDLLRFLELSRTNTDPSQGQSGLELLFSRRPDILNLQLDCENAHTPLPYIDLVNELLEHVVATASEPLFKVPDDWLVEETHDLNTEWSAAQLAAHPEHLKIEAYNRLRDPFLVAPWSLPYNLWADEVRTYLNQIGIDRTTLMNDLWGEKSAEQIGALAMEILGVVTEDLLVFAKPASNAAGYLAIWQTTNPAANLKNLRKFLRRTNMEYHEAEDIFATRFVNPTNRDVVPADVRNLDTAELNINGNDNRGLLDRFHRFSRLARIAGWPTVELDALIQNLAGSINADALTSLGVAAVIHHQFGTPLEELATWVGHLTNRGNPRQAGLYHRMFLDGTVNGVVKDGAVNLLQEVFALNGDGPDRELVVVGSNLEDWLAERSTTLPDQWQLHGEYSPVVLAGCGVQADDVIAMIELGYLPESSGKVALNLDNISQIFRYSSIARTLEISIAELLEWQQLAGANLTPGAAGAPGIGGLLLFLLGIRQQQEAGIDAATLRYGLQGVATADTAMDDTELASVTEAIRGDLQKAATSLNIEPLSAQQKIDLWLEIEQAWIVPEFPDVTDAEELAALVSAEIPLDVNLLNRIQVMLADYGMTDTDAVSVMSLISAETPPANLEDQLGALLPELEHAYINLEGNEKLESAALTYFDFLVRRPMVAQHLSGVTGLIELQIDALSTAVPAGTPTLYTLFLRDSFITADPIADSAAQAALSRLHRQAALIIAAGMSAEEITFSQTVAGAQAGVLDFADLENQSNLQWHSAVVAHQLQTTLPSDGDIYRFLGDLDAGLLDQGSADIALAELFAVETLDLRVLIGENALAFSFPNDYSGIIQLEKLQRACAHLKQAGIPAEQLLTLTNLTLNVEQANITKSAVRAKYDANTWLEVSRQLREGLRERQRNALLDYVRTRGGLDLTHEQAYAFYLIDVDMSSCYETSRTKQAIASVQQFIQRILLGMEYEGLPGISPKLQFYKEDAAEWKWRKNYRVWEANIKVFVYPENWLEPTLRDDKTEFFREFEQELMQSELTDAHARASVTSYLEKLHSVSNLEIVNCYEVLDDPYTLHVIGRTYNLPHQFYYRSWNKESWTPWQKIDADIEGEQVIPVVYNNTLYVFWALFNQEINEEAVEESGIEKLVESLEEELGNLVDPGGVIDDLTGQIEEFQDDIGEILSDDVVTTTEYPLYAMLLSNITVLSDQLQAHQSRADSLVGEIEAQKNALEAERATHSYQAIKFHWITRTDSGWSAKNMAKDPLHGPEGYTEDQYQVMATIDGGDLATFVLVGNFDYRYNGIREVLTVAKYVLSACSGMLEPVQNNLPAISPLEDFGDSRRLYTKHIVSATNTYGNDLSARGVPLLGYISEDNVEAVKHQYITRATPFFVRIGNRLFFVSKGDAGLPGAATSDNNSVSLAGDEQHRFTTHYHPYSCAFIRQIRRFGLEGLYQPEPNEIPGDNTDALNLVRQLTPESDFDFASLYQTDPDNVDSRYPTEQIDFDLTSAYGAYNWEIFYHLPSYVADQLIKNRKFEEAQRWLHFIFDPTEKVDGGLHQYWNVKPFYYGQLIGAADDELSDQLEMIDDNPAISLESFIDLWEANPFQPHLIARFRWVSYMRKTVMRYLENLIAWGDSLYRIDSMESINEATQLYVLAANILGEKPVVLEQTSAIGDVLTVREHLDGFALRSVPAGSKPPKPSEGYGGGSQGILAVLDAFCLPYNRRLLDYWDTVADRLFKIRHCQNIDGVFRKLPLFQPPIDPALLVRAAASGVDLSAILSNLSAPPPKFRFSHMSAKTTEVIGLVQNLGSALLSALEKRDVEALSKLRVENEVELLKLGLEIRKDAIGETKVNIEAMQQGQALVQMRRDFYAGREHMNTGESLDLVLRAYSWYLRTLSQVAQAAVTPLSAIPTIMTGGAGAMGSPLAITTIPQPFKPALSAVQVLGIFADLTQTGASMAQTVGGYDRRQEEWNHQVEMAEAELLQFEKQIDAANIRLAMNEKELGNHETQIEQAEESSAFIKDKFTNAELYSWMAGQLSTLYFQTYQLAFDMAKVTERCYQREIGTTDTSFIQFGYWDSMKKGLLAGERLHLDLKRMESSYLDNHNRELELSKTVSLAMLNPESLLRLRETGECYVSIPESLFDLDYPGHYFRRIKSVSLTIPALTGPYTNVSCTLTLLSDRYRNHAKTGDDESLFTWNVGSLQSIATSNAQRDAGVFQLDFQDSRYLPFENTGAISNWKLNMPHPDLAQFDYATISDVLMQINYTARDGGQGYRSEVESTLVNRLNSLVNQDTGYPQMVSVKHQYPEQWSLLRSDPEATAQTLELSLNVEHLPYFIRRKLGNLKSLKVVVLEKPGQDGDAGNTAMALNGGAAQSLLADPLLKSPATHFTTQDPISPVTLEVSGDIYASLDAIEDIVLVAMVNVL